MNTMRRVLVVDEEGGWREVVREHFRKHGFEVLEATNQARAIVIKNES